MFLLRTDTDDINAAMAFGFEGLSPKADIYEPPPQPTLTTDSVLTGNFDVLSAFEQFFDVPDVTNAPDIAAAYAHVAAPQQLALDIDLMANFAPAAINNVVDIAPDQLASLETITLTNRAQGELTFGFSDVAHAPTDAPRRDVNIGAPVTDYYRGFDV